MAGDDVVFRITVRVGETGEDAEVQVVAVTPRTVSVRIDPSQRWDSDALQQLGVALDAVARGLALRRSES